MSQLEQHVSTVRSREGLTKTLAALAWGGVAIASVAIVAILLEKLLLWRVDAPAYRWLGGRPGIALAAAGGVALVASIAWGVRRRPTARDAAIALDERLGTKEKFSTALFLQNDRALVGDPFAQAMVRDALATADRVSLADRFPIRFPRAFGIAVAIGLVAFGLTFLKQIDLFKREQKAQLAKVQIEKEEAAKKEMEQVLAQINVAPADVQANADVSLAKQNLTDMMKSAGKDPGVAQRAAAKAQQSLHDATATKEKMKNAQAFAKAKANQKMLASLVDTGDKTPVAEMARDIKNQEFDKAIDQMSKLAKDFDKMDAADQKKATEQMDAMSKQLQQAMAKDDSLKQLAQQMQQNGVTQQQVQQMQQLMQQAAQGNPQAAQQAQQMAQQMMQQAQATPQQQAAVQQLAQQMQGIQNSQAMMQQLQQASQQMAGAMQAQQQQAAQAQQGQQSPNQQQAQGQQQATQQQASGQQAGQQQQAQQQAGQQGGQQQSQQGQQQGQSQKQGGQQGAQQGQQNAGTQQQGGQQQQGAQQTAGQQPGQQQGQGQSQSMQQSAQQMQDSMDAIKKDMQQMQAAQKQGGQQGQQQGQQQGGQQGGQQPNGGQQGSGNGQGQGQQPTGGSKDGKPQQGNWNPNPGQQQGNPNQPGKGGGGGPGRGAGGEAPSEAAPFDFKEEISKSKDDEKGQTLAQTFVKADAEKGEAKAELREVVRSNLQQSTDEVDSQRISRQAQKTVRDYFTTITGDANTPTTPAPAGPDAAEKK